MLCTTLEFFSTSNGQRDKRNMSTILICPRKQEFPVKVCEHANFHIANILMFTQELLHYKDTIVHRVVPDFLVQMGDITVKDGTGGRYG